MARENGIEIKVESNGNGYVKKRFMDGGVHLEMVLVIDKEHYKKRPIKTSRNLEQKLINKDLIRCVGRLEGWLECLVEYKVSKAPTYDRDDKMLIDALQYQVEGLLGEEEMKGEK